MIILETERLRLRTWKESDKTPYFQLNQDPKVTEFLPRSITQDEATQFINRTNSHQERYGYSLWATELRASNQLIGFIGLTTIEWEAPFTPAVEIGWRLASPFWENGYATEGAKATLNYGFNHCSLTKIISFTVPANKRSIRVMEKIGMKRDFQGDFLHPKLATTHPLAPHVLYKATQERVIHVKLFAVI